MLHSTAILPAFLDKETSLISKPHHYVDVHQKIGVRLWGTEVPKHWTNMGKKLCQMAKECPTKVVWDGRSMKNFKFIKFNSVVSPPSRRDVTLTSFDIAAALTWQTEFGTAAGRYPIFYHFLYVYCGHTQSGNTLSSEVITKGQPSQHGLLLCLGSVNIWTDNSISSEIYSIE